MLIPRFSMLFLLGMMTVCAVFFYVVTLAVHGHQWATAASVAICGLMVSLLLQASTFGVAWGVAFLFGVFRRSERASSPFANAKPPPQYIEPLAPEE